MSYHSLTVAARDDALISRTVACVQQQARQNAELTGTEFAAAVRSGGTGVAGELVWPVVLNTEAEYAYALANGHDAPIGGDEAVIPDAAILSAVQAAWPATWPLGSNS